MKSNAKKLIGIALFSSFFCAGVFAVSAEVISTKGKVEVFREDEWIPLSIGDTVSESEMISTGFQSEAKIKLGDSILQLGALSRVTLETLASNNEKDVVDVYLNTGAVRSKVTHTADKKVNYTVRNPIAVASVRGTEFIFSDNGLARCFNGAIALAPARSYNPKQLKGGKSADEVESPAEGESTATTPATDIAPAAPKGSVVVLAGQTAAISTTGSTTTPIAAAKSSVTKAATTVTTAATTESVSTAASSAPATATAAQTPNPAPAPTPPKPTTGTLVVTPSFE